MQKFRLTLPFIFKIFLIQTVQSDWLRAIWAVTQKPEFSQILDSHWYMANKNDFQ